MRPRPLALGTVALLVGLFAPAAGRGQFTRIASTSTAVPGGSGNFISFDPFPSVASGGVTFKGFDAANHPGIYTGGGGTPTVIANTSTSIPSGPGPFVTLGSPAASGANVVFPGSPGGGPSAAPYFGVYANTGSGGALVRIADASMAMPGGPSNFGGFGEPASISGANVAFLGANPFAAGLFANIGAGGSLVKIVGTTTTIPGSSGSFGTFSTPMISGTTVAFGGGPGGPAGPALTGVYTSANAGPLVTVADTSTLIPNGGGQRFGIFALPSLSGSSLAFAASPAGAPGPTGVYAIGSGGALVRIADTSTAVPGGADNFSRFFPNVSISGTEVAFIGFNSAGQKGLYTNATGSLTKVIAANDLLDGHTVADLSISPFATDGTNVTFWAGFTDGTSGVYLTSVVPVPEPVAALGLAAAAAGLLGWRRARRG